MLNQLTAKLAGIEVFAGPSEATAIGNLVVQMINQGEIESMRAGRKIIRNSFEIGEFSCGDVRFEEIKERFTKVLEFN